jgi:hypothetical protein
LSFTDCCPAGQSNTKTCGNGGKACVGAALPFLPSSARERLLDLANGHLDDGVRIEVAWACAKSGIGGGAGRLIEFARDPRHSKRDELSGGGRSCRSDSSGGARSGFRSPYIDRHTIVNYGPRLPSPCQLTAARWRGPQRAPARRRSARAGGARCRWCRLAPYNGWRAGAQVSAGRMRGRPCFAQGAGFTRAHHRRAVCRRCCRLHSVRGLRCK